MIKFATFLIFVVSLLFSACSSSSSNSSGNKAIKSSPAGNNLTVTLMNEAGQLKRGNEEFVITFSDAAGKPVDVGAISLNFHMAAMGTMAAMNSPASLTTTGTPGVYRGTSKIEMAGEWQAQIAYEGTAGKGKVTIPVVAH